MARGSLSVPRKSKWVNERQKRDIPPPKPQGPRTEGNLQCKCGHLNEKVVTFSPDRWFVGDCVRCGALLTGYVAREDFC